MGSPYTEQSESGYNSSPPSDDGSQVASNQVLWATIKTKLGDPVKQLAEDIDDAVSAAFAKLISGASVSAQTDDYTVLSTDQGKLLTQSGSAKTFTTPDATDVDSPFVFAVLNLHATSTLTIDGSGSQTVNGTATITIAAGAGALLFTDGSNWFSVGGVSQAASTFTPVLAFGGTSTGLTYTTQVGNYVKTGRLVHIDINIVVNSNGSSTGSATITGLPFTNNSTSIASLAFSGEVDTPDSIDVYARVATSASVIDLTYLYTTGEEVLTETNIVDGSIIRVSGTYIASS